MNFEIIEQISASEMISEGKSIRELNRLQRVYGEGKWRKLKGLFMIRFESGDICRAELHWYEAHGLGKKDIKIKYFWSR